MTCGDPSLIPSSDCGAWCNQTDVQRRYARAGSMKDLVIKAWNNLRDAEGSPHTRSEALRARVQAYEDAYEDLPQGSWYQGFGAGNASGEVQQNVDHIAEGACLFKLLNQAAADAGGMPMTAPSLSPFSAGSLLSARNLVLAALLVAGIAYAAKRKSR